MGGRGTEWERDRWVVSDKIKDQHGLMEWTEFTTYNFGHKDIAGEPKYNYKKIIIHINLRCGGSRCSIECFGNR